jgi:arginyl-tRNA synthetase
MQNFKRNASDSILKVLKSSFADVNIQASELADMLEYPPDTTMGDLALPCFKLSKSPAGDKTFIFII